MPRDIEQQILAHYGEEVGRKIVDNWSLYIQVRYGTLTKRQLLLNCETVLQCLAESSEEALKQQQASFANAAAKGLM